jgi:hypothetical protein
VSAAVELSQHLASPTSATRAVGEFQNFTATGHYEGGGTANLTQQVVYVSSDPNVVSAPNTSGNKSHVDDGRARHRDDLRDLHGSEHAAPNQHDRLRGRCHHHRARPLERITLSPLQATRAVNQSITYTAIGHFGGGVTKT